MKETTSLSTFKESLKVNDLIWLVLQQAGEIPSSVRGEIEKCSSTQKYVQ